MKTLDYKGTKSTRFIIALLLISLGSFFLALSIVSQDNWIELMKWTFITYSTSEAAAKSATAYKERYNDALN